MPTLPAAYAGGEFSGPQVPGPGRQAVEEYFTLRGTAETVKQSLSPETLAMLQEESEAWLQANAPEILEPGNTEDYTAYDRQKATRRLVGLARHLREIHGKDVTLYEVDSTEAFVNSAFGMWESKDDPASEKLLDGSFAFVVPPRVSRANPEYGQELEDLVHVMRYVKPERRASMLRGIPPWVVDYYQTDERGNQGLLVCANVSRDMQEDSSKASIGEGRIAARNMINDAVDLAADGFGAWAIGYGATFPGIMQYGDKTRNPNVVTTTGHAGTIVEIFEPVNERYPDPKTVRALGVIGLGAIGARIADVAGDMYPNAAIRINDKKPRYVANAMQSRPGRFTPASNEEIVSESEVVVSALTEGLSLKEMGLRKEQVAGTMIMDDSQPGSFNAQEVEEMGGVVLWPIATDSTGRIQRRFCGYGDLMVNKKSDLFGCEAEVASLVALYNEARSYGFTHNQAKHEALKQAVRGPVTVEQVHQTARRFKKYGIGPSVPQSFGKPRTLPALPRPQSPHPHDPTTPLGPTPQAA